MGTGSQHQLHGDQTTVNHHGFSVDIRRQIGEMYCQTGQLAFFHFLRHQAAFYCSTIDFFSILEVVQIAEHSDHRGRGFNLLLVKLGDCRQLGFGFSTFNNQEAPRLHIY
ncbi:hypothetical protein D3C74_432270 [compost metagenome]